MSSDCKGGEENRDTVELSSDIQSEAMFTGKWTQLSLAEKLGNGASYLQFLKFIEVVGSGTTEGQRRQDRWEMCSLPVSSRLPQWNGSAASRATDPDGLSPVPRSMW